MSPWNFWSYAQPLHCALVGLLSDEQQTVSAIKSFFLTLSGLLQARGSIADESFFGNNEARAASIQQAAVLLEEQMKRPLSETVAFDLTPEGGRVNS